MGEINNTNTKLNMADNTMSDSQDDKVLDNANKKEINMVNEKEIEGGKVLENEQAVPQLVLPAGSEVAMETNDEQEKLFESLLVKNVADEDEPPCLYSIHGKDVLAKKTVALTDGKKKNGKSNWAGVLMAASVSAEHQVFNGAVRCKVEDELVCDHFDTEQPPKDIRRTLRRAMKTVGYEYDEEWTDHHINVISLKESDPDMRIRKIAQFVDLHRPDLVMVDNLGDLLPSINDEQKSNELISWLAELANTYNCSVVATLHKNEGNDKTSGWAGTVAGKKFSDSFSMKKNVKDGVTHFTMTHEGRGEIVPDLNFKIVAPEGDDIGWWELDGTSESAPSKEEKEVQYERKIRKLMKDAPVPCAKKELKKWICEKIGKGGQTADRQIDKALKYNIFKTSKSSKDKRLTIYEFSDTVEV